MNRRKEETMRKKKSTTMKFVDPPKGEVSAKEMLVRGMLARDVFERMYRATESFEPRGVGMSTAYLMGAILTWTPGKKALFWLDVTDPDDVVYMHLLRDAAPPNLAGMHEVWSYVELTGPEGMLNTYVTACIVEKEHLNKKDSEGCCMKCGHGDGQSWVDALGFADMGLADPNHKPKNVRRLPRKEKTK